MTEPTKEQVFADILCALAFHNGGRVVIPMLPPELVGIPMFLNWESDAEKREIIVTAMRGIPFGIPKL